jgi:hypothetical protein
MPTLDYDVMNVDYTTFDIDYSITDPNQTFESIGIAVFLGGVQLLGLNSTDLSQTISIDDLVSNSDYIVQLTMVYDLHDANGQQTFIESKTIHTLVHQVPELDIDVIDEYIDHVLLQIYVDDPDEVLLDAVLHVIDDEEIIQTHAVTAEEVMIITGLLSSHEYAFELVHHYDLDDGLHIIEEKQMEVVTTPTAQAPIFTMNGFRCDTSTIYIEYDIDDPDRISTLPFTVTLYNKYDVLIQTVEVDQTIDQEIVFTDLDYETVMYDFEVTIEYDLRDGVGEQTYTYYYVDIYTNYLDIDYIDQNYTTIIQDNDIVVELIINNPFNLDIKSIILDQSHEYVLTELITDVYYFTIPTNFLPLGENYMPITAIVFDNMGYRVELDINVNNEIRFTIIEDPTS